MPSLLMLLIVFSSASWATVTIDQPDCPQQFEGRVQSVLEADSPNSFLAADKVVLENRQTIRGQVPQRVQLEVVRGGPFRLEPGGEYRVQLRDGRLCWAEEI
jgi:hypothetical protein